MTGFSGLNYTRPSVSIVIDRFTVGVVAYLVRQGPPRPSAGRGGGEGAPARRSLLKA
jgi:hypothetical protein